jgi:sarcosine oxidase subunit beta
MTNRTADHIIIGGGLYGTVTAYQLAKNGAGSVVVLERGELGAGGTAKSCAIVRTHYSIEANLVHAVESLRIFTHFNELIGGDPGFVRTGYIILGPEEHREPMERVFRAQNRHGIDTAVMTPREANAMHPLLRFEDVGVIGYDSQAGYADPHMTVSAYARRARDLGVRFHTAAPVTGLGPGGAGWVVRTPLGDWEAPHVLIAAGPWSQQLGDLIAVPFPYEVSRHKVITLKAARPYEPDWPIVKDLTTPDKIYFRPETGGVVLVGTGDHGDPIQDPDSLADHIDREHVTRIESLIVNRMPSFREALFTAGWTGPYDITPDWNPVVGAVPGQEGLFIATGFSGHGFKLAPTIGESLAQTMLGLQPRLPIDMYAMERFSTGEVLQGAYGIGSIS